MPTSGRGPLDACPVHDLPGVFAPAQQLDEEGMATVSAMSAAQPAVHQRSGGSGGHPIVPKLDMRAGSLGSSEEGMQITSYGTKPAGQLSSHGRLPQAGSKAEVSCPTSCPTEDCVEAERVALSMSNDRGYFRLRHVFVQTLQDDGTLGLLLHGTSIVGFRSAQAEQPGWCVGDQIVEINKRRASNFEEFLESFNEAQMVDGFPIEFSVLRREDFCTSQPAAENVLEEFFNTTEFSSLACQLQKQTLQAISQTLVEQGTEAGDGIFSSRINSTFSNGNQVMENPYIHALNRRRDAFSHTSDGWGK